MRKKHSNTARAKRVAAAPRTVRVSAADAAALPSRTDFARLDAKTDEDIARDVASDPDAAPMFTEEMFARAGWSTPAVRTPVTIRLEPDVLAFYKKTGRGYQTRMQAVLRAFMEQSQKRAVKK